MQNYMLLFLFFLYSCNATKIPPEPRKTLAVIYNFKAHPNWQDIIVILNHPYDLLFYDRGQKSNAEVYKWLSRHRFVYGVLSDTDINYRNSINTTKIRKKILLQNLPKGIKIISNTKLSNLKQICNSDKNWLVDLSARQAVSLLKRMPRNCNYLNIWTTHDISIYKSNSYLSSILAPINTIQITDHEVLTKSLKCFHP